MTKYVTFAMPSKSKQHYWLWFNTTMVQISWFFMHKWTDGGKKKQYTIKWMAVWGANVSWWFVEGAKGNSREKIVGHHQAKASLFDHLGFPPYYQWQNVVLSENTSKLRQRSPTGHENFSIQLHQLKTDFIWRPNWKLAHPNSWK